MSRTVALWGGFVCVSIATLLHPITAHPLAPYFFPSALLLFSAAAALCDIAKAMEGRKP